MQRKRNEGMSAAEFTRRMAGHIARMRAAEERCHAQHSVAVPFLNCYFAAHDAGCRITRWHVTPEVHAKLRSVGLGGDMILGCPVVVDR